MSGVGRSYAEWLAKNKKKSKRKENAGCILACESAFIISVSARAFLCLRESMGPGAERADKRSARGVAVTY